MGGLPFLLIMPIIIAVMLIGALITDIQKIRILQYGTIFSGTTIGYTERTTPSGDGGSSTTLCWN